MARGYFLGCCLAGTVLACSASEGKAPATPENEARSPTASAAPRDMVMDLIDAGRALESNAGESNAGEREETFSSLTDQVFDTLGAVGVLQASRFLPKPLRDRLVRNLFEHPDPRSSQSLPAWCAAAHEEGTCGHLLAAIGDVGAAAFLVDQLGDGTDDWLDKRHGRTVADEDTPLIGELADIATLHPESGAELLRLAESHALKLVGASGDVSDEALRFLAAAGSSRILSRLREAASSARGWRAARALQWLGRLKDEPSFPVLLSWLARASPSRHARDTTWLGAVAGLAEWGDPRGAQPLIAVIERQASFGEIAPEACVALAYCADDKALSVLVDRLERPWHSRRDERLDGCFASALAHHAPAALAPRLVGLIASKTSLQVQLQLARAIGSSGVDAAGERTLTASLTDPTRTRAAAVALILGGSPSGAARAVDALVAQSSTSLQPEVDGDLTALFLSSDDLASGALLRWAENASAIGESGHHVLPHFGIARRTSVGDPPIGGLTAVVLRMRLWALMHLGTTDRRRGAARAAAWSGEASIVRAFEAEERARNGSDGKPDRR